MAKSIQDKLTDGDYKNKLPFVTKSTKAYRAEEARLNEEFKIDALKELKLYAENIKYHPDAYALAYCFHVGDVMCWKHPKADLLWSKAWEHGHADGLSEVWYWLQDLQDLVFP